jgi:hypothetical protein
MSRRTRSLAPPISVMTLTLILILSGLVFTVTACAACEDLNGGTSTTIGAVAEVVTTTAPASTGETAAAGESTPASRSTTSETEAPAAPSEPVEPMVVFEPAPLSPVGTFWTRFEDSDPHVAREGEWSYFLLSTASGLEYSGSLAADFGMDYAYISVYFEGTRISYVAMVGNSFGIAQVTLDGGTPVNVDLYAASFESKTVWTSAVLPSGRHHLRIQWTGSRNPSSAGSRIALDALDVAGTLVY